MATTFEFYKKIEDVEEPVMLEPDWYNVVLAKEPKLAMNSTLKGMVSERPTEEEIAEAIKINEKAGYNLVLSLKTEHPDPQKSGMDFTIWLGWPSLEDENRYSRGQKVSDAKMTRIYLVVEAFGGSIQGNQFALEEGMKANVYIDTRTTQDGNNLENFVDIFNAPIKPYQE
jgi:hypothetical protein